MDENISFDLLQVSTLEDKNDGNFSVGNQQSGVNKLTFEDSLNDAPSIFNKI